MNDRYKRTRRIRTPDGLIIWRVVGPPGSDIEWNIEGTLDGKAITDAQLDLLLRKWRLI